MFTNISRFMVTLFRMHFHQELKTEISEEYRLENPSVFLETFIRYTSFKHQISASDVVYAASALGELCLNSSTYAIEAFNEAYDCLGSTKSSEQVLSKGIKLALYIQKSIFQKASIMLERHDIKSLKRIRYAYITRKSVKGLYPSNGNQHRVNEWDNVGVDNMFERPQVLSRLGRFIMDVKISNGSWKGKSLLPLLMLCEKDDTFIITVIVPRAVDLTNDAAYRVYRNFRLLFTMAAKEGKFEESLQLGCNTCQYNTCNCITLSF